MRHEQYLQNLTSPSGPIDVVLDTDAYNEIDDQFAISYMLGHREKFRVKGICAAPFLNSRSTSPEDGMIKSYDEILKLLSLAKKDNLKSLVYKGSTHYLENEETPVCSEAASFMAELANAYAPEHPLYIIAIGAITNVASAILQNPAMKENCVLVWLGGHARHWPNHGAAEFNMRQDIAGARIVFDCGIPLVQVPCEGVVSAFTTSGPELAFWLKGKNALCDYLYQHTIEEAESYAAGKPWTRPIWDVTAVAWFLNEGNRFMGDQLIPSPIPQYDFQYACPLQRHWIRYVYHINRDALMEDLFTTLGGFK